MIDETDGCGKVERRSFDRPDAVPSDCVGDDRDSDANWAVMVGVMRAEVLSAGHPVWLCGRVSGQRQASGGNLRMQITGLAHAAGRLGLRVVGSTPLVTSGWKPGIWIDAARAASRLDAALLFSDPTRIARHWDWSSQRTELDGVEWGDILRQLHGVQVATLCSPSASPKAIETWSANWLKDYSVTPAGAAQMMVGAGATVEVVSDVLGVDRSTVFRWLQ